MTLNALYINAHRLRHTDYTDLQHTHTTMRIQDKKMNEIMRVRARKRKMTPYNPYNPYKALLKPL